jgi:hypothetical protein
VSVLVDEGTSIVKLKGERRMNEKLRFGIVALLVVGALTVFMTGTAMAQEETPTPESRPFGWRGFGRGFVHNLGGEVGLQAAAETLGMTSEELSTALWGGQSLADLANEKGVDLQDVRDAVNAAHEQAMRDAIQGAVEDGQLTQEHADWLLEGLDKGFLGDRGLGGFGSCGGPRGHRGFSGRGDSGGFSRFPGGVNLNTRANDA